MTGDLVKGWACLALATALSLYLACRRVPAIGEACRPREAYCIDVRTALACREGKLSLFACSGPAGCQVDAQRTALCDESQNAAPREACLPDYEGKGQCTKWPGAFLQCKGGEWVRLLCPDGGVCTADGGDFVCR